MDVQISPHFIIKQPALGEMFPLDYHILAQLFSEGISDGSPCREGDGTGVSLSTSTQWFDDPTLPSFGMSELFASTDHQIQASSHTSAGMAVLGWQISCLLQKNWDCPQ